MKDPNGCIILTTVCNIKDPKTVILGSGRWISFAKLLRRSSAALQELQDSPDVLHSSIGVSCLMKESKGLWGTVWILFYITLFLSWIFVHALGVIESNKSSQIKFICTHQTWIFIKWFLKARIIWWGMTYKWHLNTKN